MHTYWVRLNAVFFYGLNVLLGLSCCAWVSCLQQDLDFHSDLPRPVVDTVRVNELLSLRAHGGVDRALLSFDVQADLTPAFHWNLKQLFVFVLAEYQTPKNELNQVILWDRIVETEEQASNLQGQFKQLKRDKALLAKEVRVGLHTLWTL